MKFLKEQMRFSFFYGEVPAAEQILEKKERQDNNLLTTEYRFPGGLHLTNVAKKYDAFGAYEWVNYLENTGDAPTPIISELWDCDCLLEMPHTEAAAPGPWVPDVTRETVVLNPRGSEQIDETDFYMQMQNGGLFTKSVLLPNHSPKKFATVGGRSSGGNAPFFNVHQAECGYLIAVGWTGQWNAHLSRTEDHLRLQSKIEDTHFTLLPGEQIRTSSVLILPYRGTLIDGQNLWRRFLREEIIPKNAQTAPLSLSFWGGPPSEKVLERIDLNLSAKIPFDSIWMDAGWCGEHTQPSNNEFTGDWSERVGDWEISRHIHPNELLDVAKKIKDYNKKFIFWFEPERVRSTTRFASVHPEWLLHRGESRSLLLNLGDPDALSYTVDWICRRIRDLQIDCYRQDFNMDPLPYWRQNDTEDRRGITEIKHVMGLYQLWDTILERFPHLFIDNCASGGKRLDLEMLKRSVPLWRSDAQCPADPNPETTQANNVNFSLWIPFTGTGSGRVYDTYRMRSAYAPGGLSTTYSYSLDEQFGIDPQKVEWLRARGEEYCHIRPYFQGDLYPLTLPTKDESAWCATQWHRPERNDGMLQVFRRAHSPYTQAILPLQAINPDRTYLFTDLDGGEFSISGKALCQNGLPLTVEGQRTAKIYLYKAL